MAARRYLQSLRDPAGGTADPVLSTPIGAGATAAGGAGGGGCASPPSPSHRSVTFRDDYKSGIVSGRHVLDGRLEMVRETIEEFFDDRDLQVVSASASNVDSQNTLGSLTGALRRLPLFPGSQEFPVKEKLAAKVVKKKSLLSVFKVVQGRARDKRILYLDVLLTAMSCFGVLLMFVANNVAFWSSSALSATRLTDELGPVVVAALRVVYYFIFGSTLGVLIVIAQYYRLQLYLKRHEWSEVNGQQVISRTVAYNFWKGSLPFKMLAEVAVHCVFPYPWYNQLDSQGAKYLELFMFARLYTAVRLLHHASSLFRFRNDILNNTLSLKRANFSVGVLDTMKVYLFSNTVVATAVLYTTISVVGGFCVFVAEQHTPNTRFRTTLDGVYFMVITIRAIGFGDLVPLTVVGRVVTVIFQFLGAAVETLAASIVVNKIAKSKDEKVVDEYLLSFAAWHKFRVASAMVIQAFWKTSRKYQYLHKKISQEKMVQLVKAQKRRKDFLLQLSFAKGRVKVKDADASGILSLRLEDEAAVLHKKELRNILHHYSTHQGHKTSHSRCFNFGVYNMRTNAEDDASSLRARMPYMREKDSQVDSHFLIEKNRRMFSLDNDISRWGRNFSSVEPRNFKKVRTFSSTRKVVGHHGERRIPVSDGHKADLRLESLAIYRQARLEFKQSIAPSADHVVDGKLYIAYELLVSASAKLKRNVILLLALRKAAEQELQSAADLVDLSMSGGVLPAGEEHDDARRTRSRGVPHVAPDGDDDDDV